MTTVASFRKRTPKSSPTTSPAPLTDPTLCALLLFIAGEHADHEFIARAGAVADAGAHAMLSSRPLIGAFSDCPNRPDMRDLVTEAVLDWFRAREPGTKEDRSLAQIIRRAMDGESSAVVPAMDNDQLTLAFSEFADRGILLGFCLAYRMLKGGVQ